MTRTELQDKIAKMKAGLNNPNITGAVQESLQKAIDVAKKQLEEMILSENKKNKLLIQNDQGEFYSKDIKTGKSIWQKNFELASVYNSDEINEVIEYLSKQFPSMQIKETSIDNAKKVKKTNDLSFEDWMKNENISFYKRTYYWVADDGGKDYLFHGEYNDVKKELKKLYESGYTRPDSKKINNDPKFFKFNETEIMFVPVENKYYVDEKEFATIQAAEKYIESKKPDTEKTLEFFKKITSNKSEMLEAIKKVKELLGKEKQNFDFLIQEMKENNFIILMRLKKVKNLLVKEYDLDASIFDEILQLKSEDKALNKVIVNDVLRNFVTKSQLAASQSSELDQVVKDVYLQIMSTPLVGDEVEETKFHLHYFNPNSDMYIAEVDYGTGQQDYGYAILNGDLQNAEFGYLSINELLKAGFELDYYFEPILSKNLIEKLENKQNKKLVVGPEIVEYYNKYGKKEAFLYNNKNRGLDGDEQYNVNYNWIKSQPEIEKPSSTEKKYILNEISENVKTYKKLTHDEVLPVYRKQEENNNHTANVLLMAVKVGSEAQIERAESLLYEHLDKKAVDAPLREKIDKLYQELHENFREKFLKVDDPTIPDTKINKLVTLAIAQIFMEYGNNTEIKSIKEVVSDNQIDVHFEVIRELESMRDRIEKVEVHITFEGEILDEFTFKVPSDFNAEKFISTLLDDIDSRTSNQIVSFASFLKEESQRLIGESVGVKTVKKLDPEKQAILKKEYQAKAASKKGTKEKDTGKASPGKIKLTKRLIAHGVTQEMINTVNKTKEGIVISAYSQTSGKNTKADKNRVAMLPGKRLSADGTIYYETRKDRSDKDPLRKI